MKKTTFVAGIVLLALVAASFPGDAQASWFGEKLTASIFSAVSTFFQKVGSAITETVSKILPSKSSSGQSSETSCIPPVSPKPNGEQHSYGTMTVAPEISQASADNTITISLNTHINLLAIYIYGPQAWLEEAIDWGPKQAELNEGKGISIENPPTRSFQFLKWDTYKYTDANKQVHPRPRLAAQKYWVKVKAPSKTVTDRSDQSGDEGGSSYGWRKISYKIAYIVGDTGTDMDEVLKKEIKWVEGNDFFFIGGPQFPTGKIVRAGTNTEYPGGVRPGLSLVTVKAGEPFEIEARPTGWQGGTMTLKIDPKSYNGRIIGSDSIAVKAGESAIWKILPTGSIGSVKGYVNFTNDCDRLFFAGSGSSIRMDSFDLGIKFDFKGLTEEKSNLAFHGGVAYVLGFGKQDSSLDITPALSLIDGRSFVANVPDFKLELQAVYKDNPQEIVKSVLITPKGKAQQAGSATAVTNKDGETVFKITAPNVTREEVTRGILLKATAPEIPGLKSEQELRFTGISIDITKPQTPPAPTPQPQPTPQPSIRLPVQNVIVSANKAITELTEKDKVTFTAKLMLTDGSLQTTKNVKWAVLGQIGSITAEGVFTAKLDESIAEAGEALGFVTATYEDSAGNAFLGQTTLIKVKAFILDQPETQG